MIINSKYNTDIIRFPDVNIADEEGLLAAGGNLEIETLLSAYSQGIFPWYRDGSPILWWSPDPRLVLFPEKLKISKSLSQKLNQQFFEVKFDENFEQVIHNCAKSKRKEQAGTWITREMQEAYCKLHQEGFAHSVETYFKGELVGGLYGVSLGAAFFGESMFYTKSDASKVALYYLVKKLKAWNFKFIDAQQSTSHLKSLGAEEISRKVFLNLLKKALQIEGKYGRWSEKMVK